MNRPAEEIATGTPDAYDNSTNTLLDDGYLDSSLEESPMQDRTWPLIQTGHGDLINYNTLVDSQEGGQAANSPLSPSWKEVMTAKKVPEGSTKASIFNLTSTIIGGGVLSIPYAFACTGLAVGVIMLLVMSSASAYSAYLLLSCARRCGGKNYEDIAVFIYGRTGGTFVNFLVFLLVYLACIGYIVLMGDLLTQLIPPIFPSDEWLNRVAMMGSCVVVIYPVTLLRNISALRITSFVSVIAIMFLAGAIIDKSIRINENFVPANATSHHGSGSHKFLPVEDPCLAKATSRFQCIKWVRFDFDFLLAIPILSCSFMCHFNVLPVHLELRRPTRQRMKKVIYWTMGLAAFLYLLVAIAGYLSFFQMLLGKNGGNVLNLYSKGDFVITMGRAGLVMTLLLSFPLLTHPCRATIEVLFFDRFWSPSNCRSIFISTLISVTSYLIAIFVPSITVVWTLTGSTDAIVVAYVLPALFYLKLTKGSICNRRKLPAAFLFVAGVALSIVCTYASVMNVIKMKH